jgi:hypothetical protein
MIDVMLTRESSPENDPEPYDTAWLIDFSRRWAAKVGVIAMLTTLLDVFTLVLVFAYGFLAPTQVLELPVSMMRLSKKGRVRDYPKL